MPTPAEHAWMLAQLGTTHPQSLVTPKAELASMWTTTMERVVASSADIRTQLAANAEAPRWVLPAALAPEAFLGTVRAFFEHAARGARAHLGVTDNARIARRGWSWRETHELNAKIDWAGFRADDDGTGTTR